MVIWYGYPSNSRTHATALPVPVPGTLPVGGRTRAQRQTREMAGGAQSIVRSAVRPSAGQGLAGRGICPTSGEASEKQDTGMSGRSLRLAGAAVLSGAFGYCLQDATNEALVFSKCRRCPQLLPLPHPCHQPASPYTGPLNFPMSASPTSRTAAPLVPCPSRWTTVLIGSLPQAGDGAADRGPTSAGVPYQVWCRGRHHARAVVRRPSAAARQHQVGPSVPEDDVLPGAGTTRLSSSSTLEGWPSPLFELMDPRPAARSVLKPSQPSVPASLVCPGDDQVERARSG